MPARVLLILGFVLFSAVAAGEPQVSVPPETLIQSLKLKPFYKKYLDSKGLPILSSEKVSDHALLEANYLINQMLDGRDDIRAAMAKNKVRFAVMAYNEYTTMVPEHSDLTPPRYWDKRARGLGATPARPAVSCGEENLLCFPGDPYSKENILVHEFAHAIHEMGLRTIDKTFDERLNECFDRAKKIGLWKGTYALSNPMEYWAEGVQSWFDCNNPPNHDHNDVSTREELIAYDSELAKLIESVFSNKAWRYTRPDQRKEKAHLATYDATKAAKFEWPVELVPKTPDAKPSLFLARIEEVTMTSRARLGDAILLSSDARWVMVLQPVDDQGRSTREKLKYAIHSPTQFLHMSAEEAKGKTLQFEEFMTGETKQLKVVGELPK